MGKLLCLMGKSSSGKDTIYKKIKEQRPNLITVVPYTTRPIREGEQNGREYHFIDEEKMLQLEKQGKIIESRCYETVHGPWYYMTVDDGQINLQEGNYLYIGTIPVYESLKNYYCEESIVPIYIEVDDGIRLSRALERERGQKSPKYAEMCRRYLADEEDFSPDNLKKAGIDHFYKNEDLMVCVNEILANLEV
ncbi:guanylate kinase [Eubacterium oxidoreducens]|uniref:Guanylate kinase n=1 Tax=Eubacterium oxidoreducens TaxID=1732 RepID=A0A1G5ZZL8_EUBOX|nr:guanylate kinase [Eubacterium oxidoreducens]SDB01641.1 Guanylate kinase [Eubacterium oxidoreducens]